MAEKKEQRDVENRDEIVVPQDTSLTEQTIGNGLPNSVESHEHGNKNPLSADKTIAEDTDDGQDNTPSVIQALHNITAEEDDAPIVSASSTIKSILGGDILGGRWFRKQVWYILMLTAMIVVYVSNRYACQQEMIEQKVLNDTLLDRRYKALTRSSQLKERTRRSHIESALSDSTLHTAKTPSFRLKIEE